MTPMSPCRWGQAPVAAGPDDQHHWPADPGLVSTNPKSGQITVDLSARRYVDRRARRDGLRSPALATVP